MQRTFRPVRYPGQHDAHLSSRVVLRRRPFSSSRSCRKSEPSNTSSTSTSSPEAPTRFDRLQKSWLFRPLNNRILSPLRNAPISTITAFLILHELTAIIPLFTLAGIFHYTQWLPAYFSEGAWVIKGVELFGRYFRRKGWISDEAEREAEREAKQGKGNEVEEGGKKKKRRWGDSAGKWFGRGEVGTRVVMEFATAWAIVKVLIPLRLTISVWWAEGFARRIVRPLGRLVIGKGKASKGPGSGAAGTGAVGGGGTSSGKGR